MDSIVGADLGAKTAADTALGTTPNRNSAFCVRCAGDDHVFIIIHRQDQISGTSLGAGHTAGALFAVDLGNTIYHFNSVKLAGSDTIAVAKTAKLAGERTVAAHLGGG